MAKAAAGAIDSLKQLGFSEMEAMIYCELLRRPASTGYAIAKALGRPHANVYQGLSTLEANGAVFAEAGAKKTFIAVPPDALFERVREGFDQKCTAAAASLAQLEVQARDEGRVYNLRTRELLFQQARTLLAEAGATIIFQGVPAVAEMLRPDLLAAHRRGVKVAGLVFREEDVIPGTRMVVSKIADRVLAHFPADTFNLVVDGREMMVGLLSPVSGDVRSAVWVRSTYVAAVFHNALVSDTILHEQALIREIGSPANYLFGGVPPGFVEAIGAPRNGDEASDGGGEPTGISPWPV